MCNAWNHPPGCSCGWGGDELSGVRLTDHRFNSIESFTNPNAQCPACGDAVFFYQSPHGGKVFFDELGPPWEKHPCTDGQNENHRTISTNGEQLRETYKWQAEGWTPVLNAELDQIGVNLWRVSSPFEPRNHFIYTPESDSIFDPDFVHMRPAEPGKQKISLFSADYGPLELACYESTDAAIQSQSQERDGTLSEKCMPLKHLMGLALSTPLPTLAKFSERAVYSLNLVGRPITESDLLAFAKKMRKKIKRDRDIEHLDDFFSYLEINGKLSFEHRMSVIRKLEKGVQFELRTKQENKIKRQHTSRT